MAAGTPAGAANDVLAVIDAAMHDLRRAVLRLEMTLIAQADVARFEHLVVYRTVGRMAHDAAFAHHFMLKDERTGLRRMAFRAGRINRSRQGFRASGRRIGIAPMR